MEYSRNITVQVNDDMITLGIELEVSNVNHWIDLYVDLVTNLHTHAM